ncbi:MAG TPA: 3-hydroxyacyl-CoA dehydrogenase NAD-binding domain-containing protein [Steroidobacteraceae bacterium]|nr:3-hydroxyacyl-CoA dehydrogenase NAD-binding domain-containing protein [Steroidobacteraceae bacterium]
MPQVVQRSVEGAVARITIDHPPVNALSRAVRAQLLEAIVAAEADPAVQLLVLEGAGAHFSAGADISEMTAGAGEPLLNDVLLRLERCAKPVLAAVHGTVFGGGLELALASHYRCAARGARLALPEVKLGLIPGSGGTQRLPRAIGLAAALELMISGESIDALRAHELGLLDEVVQEEDFGAGVRRLAARLVASHAPVRRLSEQPIPDLQRCGADYPARHWASLSATTRSLTAVQGLIRSVQAAIEMPFNEALALSRVVFEECRQSPQSRALRHLFFAERAARRGARGATAPEVRHVAVVGAGTMGAGIATALLQAGFSVAITDSADSALGSVSSRIAAMLDSAVRRGRLSAEQAAQRCAHLLVVPALAAALQQADLVIEAVVENLAVKQALFGELGRLCLPATILATNTSALDVDAIATASGRAHSVLGMHFFSPAQVMRLVEIVRGRESSAAALASAEAVTARLGKLGVIVGNAPGFVGNRMLYAYGRESQLMLLEGATPSSIDAALTDWGMALGPCAVGDLAGLDVGYRARRELPARPDDPRYFRIADLLAERGWLGRKSGRGYYRYEGDGRARVADPEVQTLIRAEAQRLGVPQRQLSAVQITERCIYALINEGARVLDEGIAHCADDIDVIWCNGYGFPRVRGGPMCFADESGVANVLEGVNRMAREHGARYWTPAPLLASLAASRGTFGAWHRPG